MDAEDWNARYDTAELIWRGEPNVFLAAESEGLPAGRALDLACGEGRNAVWLATRGWSATGVDFADVGLAKGERLAAEHGVEVTWICADATSWAPPPEGFDLVAVCYLQLAAPDRGRALAVAARALAPGGTMLVIAHDARNLAEGVGGPQDPVNLYGPDAVLADLAEATAQGAPALVVHRAETVERVVGGAERPALDCLVRAVRPT